MVKYIAVSGRACNMLFVFWKSTGEIFFIKVLLYNVLDFISQSATEVGGSLTCAFVILYYTHTHNLSLIKILGTHTRTWKTSGDLILR